MNKHVYDFLSLDVLVHVCMAVCKEWYEDIEYYLRRKCHYNIRWRDIPLHNRWHAVCCVDKAFRWLHAVVGEDNETTRCLRCMLPIRGAAQVAAEHSVWSWRGPIGSASFALQLAVKIRKSILYPLQWLHNGNRWRYLLALAECDLMDLNVAKLTILKRRPPRVRHYGHEFYSQLLLLARQSNVKVQLSDSLKMIVHNRFYF